MKSFKKIFILIYTLLLITIIFSYKNVLAETENYDKLKVTSVTITDRKTGKAPFDSQSDMDGNDENDSNEYLRTYDTLTYTLELTIARNEYTTTPDEVITGGRIYVKATIPTDNGVSMGFEKDSWMKDYHSTNDRSEITAYWEIPSGSSPTSGTQQLSFTIKAMGYERELTAADMPKFEVWMEGNKPDNGNSQIDSKIIQDTSPIKITGRYMPDFDMDKGLVNNAGEKDGVKGQYIGFVTRILTAGRVGSQVPTNSIKAKYTIRYEYKKSGTSSYTNYKTIEVDNPIYGTTLYSYGRPFEATPGFWPDENKNKSDDDEYKASSNSNYNRYDSGTMTASLTGQNATISSENTGFYSYSMEGYSNIVTQGYELFVPFYEPEPGEKYDYRIVIAADSIIFDNDLDTEEDPSKILSYTYSNYLTGNFSYKSFHAEGRVYNENSNSTSYPSDNFSDIDPLPIDKRRGFVSSINAVEGPYEGGLERLIVWNSEAVDFSTYKLPSLSYDNQGIFSTPSASDAIIKYGVYKDNPNNGVLTDALVNSALNSDFDWYDSVADATSHGKIAAVLAYEPTWRGYSVSTQLTVFLTPKDEVEAIGKSGIIRHKVVGYEDSEKTIRHEFGYDKVYTKAVINADGTALETNASPTNIGETYYVTGITLNITSLVPKYTYNVEEELVDVTVNPSFTLALNDTSGTGNFKIQAEIPIDLAYVSGSANRVPTSVIANPDGTQTIIWEINDWNMENPLPTITYKLEINPYTANNSSKSIVTYLSSPLSPTGKAEAYTSMEIVNLSGSSLRQKIADDYIDVDQDTIITDYLYNIAQRTLNNVKTLEILPKDGDSNGSHFSGNYTLEVVSLANTQKMYYTTTPISDLGLATDSESNTKYIPNSYDLDTNTNWIEVHVGDTIPANATAVATYIPSILGTTDINYQFKLIPNGNGNGDRYRFKIAAFSDNLENVISSDLKTAVITNRKITGYVFLDRNKNDIYDSSVDSILPNKEISLYDETDNLLGTATTDSNGYYEFSGLSRENYYIKYVTESYETIVTKNAGNYSVSSILNPSTGSSDLITDLDINPVAEVIIADNKNIGLKYKEATIKVHHYLVGTETRVHNDDEFTKLYTETYVTGAYGSAQLDADYVNIYAYNNTNDGDNVSGVVTKDNYEVIYYYDYKPVEIRVHHFLVNTNIAVHDDVIINSHYTAQYETSAIDSANLYDDYKGDYVYNNTNAGDSVSGIVQKDYYDVVYYYDLKPTTITVHHYAINSTTKLHDDDVYTNYKYRDTYVTSNYATADLTNTNYYYNGSHDGDPISTVVNKDSYEIIYYYELIPSSLTVHHYLVGTTTPVSPDETDTVYYGQTYVTNRKNLTDYQAAGTGGDATSEVVTKPEIVVIYYYELKPATVTVHHYVTGTTDKVHEDDTYNLHYTDPYDTNYYASNVLDGTYQNNYQYSGTHDGDDVSGNISKDNYVINYYYNVKTANLVVHHYILNTETRVHDDDTTTVNYGTTYTTVYYGTNDLYDDYKGNYQYSSYTGDNVADVVSKDSYEVIYYYDLKPATVTVHHYLSGSSTKVQEDQVYNVHYTNIYTTSYHTPDELFDDYKNNYDFKNSTGDLTSDTVSKDNYVINYFYDLRDAVVTTHHYIKGTTTKVHDDKDYYYHFTDQYETYAYSMFDLYDEYNELYIYSGESDGDKENGTIEKTQYDVNFYYVLKQGEILVHHYIEGTTTPVQNDQLFYVDYTAQYTTSYYDSDDLATAHRGKYEYVSTSGDLTSDIVSKDHYEIFYYYRLKTSTINVHHYIVGTTTKVADDGTFTRNYGESFDKCSLASDELYDQYKNKYEYVSFGGESPNILNVNRPSYDIIYYYRAKPSNITVHHYVTGTEDKVHEDDTIPSHYGETYTTNYYSPSELIGDYKDKYQYSSTAGDPVSTEVIKDNYEVIYYYDIMASNILVHHYIVDTTTKVADDNTIPKNYGDTYTTRSLASDELYDEYKNKYEYVSTSGDLTSDTVNKDNYEVIYYYTLKTSKITIHHYLTGTTTPIADDVEKTDKIGNSYTSSAVEVEGYVLKNKPTSETHEFTIEDQVFVYEYEKIMLKIEIEAEGEGVVTGSEEIPYGDDSTPNNIVITPNDGYVISKITVNGEEIEVTDINKMILPGFENVKGDIEIKVEFKEQEKEEPTEDEPNEEIIIDTETPITVDRILTYITLFLISLMVFVNIVLYKKRKA